MLAYNMQELTGFPSILNVFALTTRVFYDKMITHECGKGAIP